MTAVAAATVLFAGCGGRGESSNDVTPGQPGAQIGTTTTVDGTPFACPVPSDRAPVGGADTLPSGARAALLCARDTSAPWVAPRGALRRGLDHLVQVVNTQRVHDPDSEDFCGGVGAPGWTIVLRYADGTRTIQGDNGGCWGLAVGTTQRFGSKRVFDAFNRALLRQRSAESSPETVFPMPPCPSRRDAGSFSPLADAAHATSAAVCQHRGHKFRPDLLTRTQIRMLRHDFATATTRRTHLDGPSDCHALPATSNGVIVGVDPWGDPFTVLTTCDTYRLLQPARHHYLFARMLPATARMLRPLLNG